MLAFFMKLFSTDGFPRRWECGEAWAAEPGLGWLHIISDVAIFGAYTAIPLMLVYFVFQKKLGAFLPVFWLFAAFILACGFGHLIESTLFWQPWYRFRDWSRDLQPWYRWSPLSLWLLSSPSS